MARWVVGLAACVGILLLPVSSGWAGGAPPIGGDVFINFIETPTGVSTSYHGDVTVTPGFGTPTSVSVSPIVDPTRGLFALGPAGTGDAYYGLPFNLLGYDFGPGGPAFPPVLIAPNFFGIINDGSLLLPPGHTTGDIGSGSMFFQNSTFATLGIVPNNFDVLIGMSGNTVHFLFTPLPPVNNPGARTDRSDPDPVLLTDVGAINSLLTSGLLMPTIQRGAVQNAATNATRDLNSRLFRARSGMQGGDFDGDGDVDGSDYEIWRNNFGSSQGVGDTNADGEVDASDFGVWRSNFNSTMDGSLNRYLNFVGNQNIDYRVALGLREGIEVEFQEDSLARSDVFWASSPMAMVGGPVSFSSVAPIVTGAVIAAPQGQTGGKEVFEDKVVIEETGFKRFGIFSEFDYGFYDQDALTNLVRGFDSDTYAGSVGMEYRVFPWLHVGGAFTYLESNTDVASNLGSVDLDGTALSGYFTAFWKQFYLDALYSYGDYNNEVNRDTLLGSTAHGDTDSYSHNIDLNVGYNQRLTDQIVTGPIAGLNYATGGIDGYTETNGGNANLIYPDDNFESMVGRLGWQLTYSTDTQLGRVTTQGRVGWAHEFMPEADTVRAGLSTSPFLLVTGNNASRVGSFASEANSAHPGTDWVELGAGIRVDLDNSWNLQLDYEGQFARNNASAHFAAIKLEYEWGEVFLPRRLTTSTGGKNVVVMTETIGHQGNDATMENAIAANPSAPAGSSQRKGLGLRSLFAGKSKAKSPSENLAPGQETPDAIEEAPFVFAELPSTMATTGEGSSAVAKEETSEANQPVIYESWDQVPGRKKAAAAEKSEEAASTEDADDGDIVAAAAP